MIWQKKQVLVLQYFDGTYLIQIDYLWFHDAFLWYVAKDFQDLSE